HALRRVVPISPRLLRGNAASALAGAATMLGATPDATTAWRLAATLLDHEALRGTGTWEPVAGREQPMFRRRSCCLYYRVPGGGDRDLGPPGHPGVPPQPSSGGDTVRQEPGEIPGEARREPPGQHDQHQPRSDDHPGGEEQGLQPAGHRAPPPRVEAVQGAE